MAKTLFLTHRGIFHQQRILAKAPVNLEITLLRNAGKDDILSLLPEMEFLITEREDVIDAQMIGAGRRLRLIQRLGSQTWDIDLEAARTAGIPVCYWPDPSTIHVAEHCLMQTLCLLKKTREMISVMDRAAWDRRARRCDEDTFAFNWSKRTGIQALYAKTAGILGLGEIGRALIPMLRGFNCRILYNKRRRMPERAENELVIGFASIDELLSQSDVLYCLLPFSAEGAESINAAVFARMKPGAYFVFCGGSGMVNENDLIAALRSGRLAGAALDTYTFEPLSKDNPLLELHREAGAVNLLLTPHVAAAVDQADRMSEYTNLLRLMASEPLLFQLV